MISLPHALTVLGARVQRDGALPQGEGGQLRWGQHNQVSTQGPTAQAKLGGGGDSDQSTAVSTPDPKHLYPNSRARLSGGRHPTP